MNDCSTAAMLPKEPPKTCGTCASFVRAKGYEHLGICSEIYFVDECGGDAFAAVRDTRICDNPSLYKPRPDILEQRCQQLEQVAREMWRLIRNIERKYPSILYPGKKPGGQMVRFLPSEEYAARLEDLGVSVGD